MPSIFISYRREDSAGYAGWLKGSLKDRFGRDEVFQDIDGIKPGRDFVQVVEEAVGSCRVLIVLIGPRWSKAQDSVGRRRLDLPEDIVRLEIAAALARGIRLIPALIRGAVMPASSELPPDLAQLARLNALELSDERWEYDVGRLVKAIEDEFMELAIAPSRRTKPEAPKVQKSSPSPPPVNLMPEVGVGPPPFGSPPGALYERRGCLRTTLTALLIGGPGGGAIGALLCMLLADPYVAEAAAISCSIFTALIGWIVAYYVLEKRRSKES